MSFVFCGVVLAILAGASWIAHRAFAPAERLPIRWDLRGRPAGYAPRLAALAFTPLLAAAILGLILFLPEGSGGRKVALAISGGAFLLAHFLHLRLIRRSLA